MSRILSSNASALCALAVLWLAGCGGPPVTPPVHRTTNYIDQPPTEPAQPKKSAAPAQTQLRDQNASENLEFLLWDADRDVREAALESMMEMNSHPSAATLALLITDADAQLRQTVVDALTDIGSQEAIELLQDAIYDPNVEVREAAFDGLVELGATN